MNERKKRRMKTGWSLVLCITVWISALFRVSAEDIRGEAADPVLYARSAVLMDADSGRVLFEKNGYDRMAMASTTKIMTCILALELGDPEAAVTVSKEACRQPKVHLGMQEGQKFRMKDLLYSLMLESHNDTAVAVAEHIGGSVDGFAGLMNRKAESLGCRDTFFITPNGLDAQQTDEQGETRAHSTTARDLALIMRYCIGESEQRDAFLEITRTQDYTFTDLEGRGSYYCRNHNAFLTMMDGALSGKTGFTNQAGYCYVGALERDGKRLIVALLACGWPSNKGYKWEDTKVLMNYGLDNYFWKHIHEETDLPQMIVEGGAAEGGSPWQTSLIPMGIAEGEEMEISVLMREGEQIKKVVSVPGQMTAPVRAGMEVGSVSYYLEGELLRKYSVMTLDGVEKMDFYGMLTWIGKEYFLFCSGTEG